MVCLMLMVLGVRHILATGNLKLLTGSNALNWFTPYFLLVSLFASVVVRDVQAAVLIDDFTTAQSVLNGSTGPVNVTGTQLSNLMRTITATASPDDAETAVDIRNGFLNIFNDFGSTGTVSIFYSFDADDLASVADGFLFNIGVIDLDSEIELIANETSVFGFANLGAQTLYEIEFAQFTNPAVFKNLTSLRLNFRGVEDWDGQFGLLTVDSNKVPEPSTLLLLAFGLTALGRSRPGGVVKNANADRVAV